MSDAIHAVMISIIIVHYHVKKELFNCIASILASEAKTPYEIIVIDNDEHEVIKTDLKKIFPQVIYHKTKTNLGYGAGNNIGSNIARGKYLFFLNPDTKFLTNVIDVLISCLKKDKQIGIAAPLLLDTNGNFFKKQGVRKLTIKRAVFAFSFLSKIFPQNKIVKDYWLEDWDKKTAKEVDVVPGTAFIIRKDVFEKTGRFDEKYFLFFEEHDLCMRIKKTGLKMIMLPGAKIQHLWGRSTPKTKEINKIFMRSRFRYFKKFYGIFPALFTEMFLRITKYTAILILILILGSWLRFYHLEKLMTFIGDQGWFYLSARNMLISGNIPLVGIPSSHPWLHQGPWWTYILVLIFLLTNFHPLAPAYVTAGIGVITILLCYFVTSTLFSKKTGLIAALLYATSPLIIMHDRMPYHTSFIPVVSLFLIYFTYRWVKENRFFPLLIFLLALLYNLELSNFVFLFSLVGIVAYVLIMRKRKIADIYNKKTLSLSVIAFTFPMLPMLIYDFKNEFPQTVGFVVWLGYRILRFFGYPPIHPEIKEIAVQPLNFFISLYQKLIFLPNDMIAITIFLVSLTIFNFLIYKNYYAERISYILLALFLYFPLVGYIVNKTPSEAYFPALFAPLIIVIAISYDYLLNYRVLKYLIILLLIVNLIANSLLFILKENYREANGITFAKQIKTTKEIVKIANNKPYNLVGKGEGSEFASYTMGYTYLTWWLGNPPVVEKSPLQFIIEEKR